MIKLSNRGRRFASCYLPPLIRRNYPPKKEREAALEKQGSPGKQAMFPWTA
jgi:hypothetical protein